MLITINGLKVENKNIDHPKLLNTLKTLSISENHLTRPNNNPYKEFIMEKKIFISHSSKNKNYGEILVELLRNLGVKENEIIFTSNIAYGIPIGHNIFNWLKGQISNKPFVIYLLSEDYYKSIACLNEMGAAWIIENQHAAIFTPHFNLASKEFQNGALDPREIGFYINDQDRIMAFIDMLTEEFSISKSPLLISQYVKKFLIGVESIENSKAETLKIVDNTITLSNKTPVIAAKIESGAPAMEQHDLFSKFISSILLKKLKDDEIILVHYIIDTGRVKLMAGWQESQEINNIKEWEKINNIKNLLSTNYNSILTRFEIRGFIEISAVTSYNNPKEYKLKNEISIAIFDFPQDGLNIIKQTLEKNYFEHKDSYWIEDNNLPF